MNLHHPRDTNTTEHNSSFHSPLRENKKRKKHKERKRGCGNLRKQVNQVSVGDYKHTQYN